MCKVITNNKEIQKFVEQYFGFMSEEKMEYTLEKFAKKEGIGSECVVFLFNNEVHEAYQIYGLLGDNRILFAIDYPAAEENCEAYLTFDQFYRCLEETINKVLKKGYREYNKEKGYVEKKEYNKDKIISLLGKVKKGLGGSVNSFV